MLSTLQTGAVYSAEDLAALPYQFCPGPGTYSCAASPRQTWQQGHNDAVPHPVAADTTFNWGVRRGELLLVSGDFPRFAFLTRRREARNNPPHLKLGDARLTLMTDQGLLRWEEASSIIATFHPTWIEHCARWATLPGVVGRLRVGLAGASEAMVQASLQVETGASFSGFLVLDFGGISTHGRTFSAAYFPPDSPDDPATVVTLSGEGGVLSCPGYPERVAFHFAAGPELDVSDGRVTAKWPVDLADGGHWEVENTWRLLVDPTQPAPVSLSATTLTKIAANDATLLGRAAASTPDGFIGPGLDAAILTLESCWDRSAWLEGVHWWSCYWANDYQISAAVALGQWDRARQALEFFLDEEGYCPARLADGSRMDDGASMGRYDALPFWLRQFALYVDATGDRALILSLRPKVEKCIGRLLAAREKEPAGLFNWFKGANSTVYQADHLGWPGEATSVSFLVARALRDWGHLCQEAGESEAGAHWTQRADQIEQLARARLWDTERGCFFSHRDYEGHTYRNHYYSDHVYPVLYGTVLSVPEAASVLDVLRHELIFALPSQRLLMRVGTYQPPLFANDNVMPTQMAETAMAFAKLGQNETAARLLHSVAVAATLDTDSPGSFPERLTDLGKGEANYGFGNPAGAYATAVVHGLFGVVLSDGGGGCDWHPSFPDHWPSAELRLPWVELGYIRSTASAGMETRTYSYASDQPRELRFQVFLPAADAYQVLADQSEASFALAPGLNGTWLTLAPYTTRKSSIAISFTPTPATIVPLAFTAKPPVALVSAELTVEKAAPDSALAKLRLQLGPAPGMFIPGVLTIDLSGSVAVLPWHGETDLSLDVPAPRSGLLLAAIPLRLRVKLASAEGSILLQRELIVTPRGIDPVAQRFLQDGRASQANAVPLDALPQASTLHVTFPWRYNPNFDLQLRAYADRGFDSDGEHFPVCADRDSFCLVDGGNSDPSTRLPLPCAVPNSLAVPVHRRVCAVSILFASEMEMRLCASRIGEVRFVYAQPEDEIVPLVAGENFDALRGHSAPACSPIALHASGDQLNLLRLPCDGSRLLDQIVITIQKRDARLALIALHTFAIPQ